MILTVRKKPVVVEAVRWMGDNYVDIQDFLHGMFTSCDDGRCLLIKTLEGDMKAQIGDYILRGVKGEFYPCKPDIFAKTYEIVTGER